MLLVDIGISLVAAVILSWMFLRLVHEHGPWQKPWAFGLVVFLFAWAGGAWIAPGLAGGWVTHWIPFVLVGLLTAVLIVTVSPRHDLASPEDADQLEREEEAVLLSVTVLYWVLTATVAVLIVGSYLR
ncbi:MAG TPA: hypothetical protein ENI85_02940 [Deltaproteobacteria bacterium]|nr:hypothetical protein [Deltaproteobacteria bacterium]